jgi:hypothetical protein
MRTSEERLAGKDTGETTRRIQHDILKDLDSHVEQIRRRQPSRGTSRDNSSEYSHQRSQQVRGDKRTKEAAGDSQKPAEKRRPLSGQTAQGGDEAKTKTEKMSKIADLYKDVWGHLPETLRQEMDQYSREQFMPKYGDLLKQYYTIIAEKGRRKGD